jgi:hypothetical protein
MNKQVKKFLLNEGVTKKEIKERHDFSFSKVELMLQVALNKGHELPKDSVSPRFIVDERNGCIGIRDSEHPKFEEINGLNQDMPDVVAFEMGTQINTGNFVTWDLSPEIIEEFKDRCAFLNEC